MNHPFPLAHGLILVAAAAAAAALPAEVLAQAAPPPHYGIGDALKASELPPCAPPVRPPPPLIVAPPERPMGLPSGETLTVAAFKVEGAEVIAESEWQDLLQPLAGRALSMADIEAAAARVTALCRSRGYLLARAYVPRQDASLGTLRIQVLMGHIGQVTLKNRSGVHDDVLLPLLAPLQPGALVFQPVLEAPLLLVADVPGAAMPALTISPGQQPGSSDLEIAVPSGPRWSAHLVADNLGSRQTGEDRLSASVELNSLGGMGDRLALNLMGANGGGLTNGRLSLGVPLAGNGLRGEVATAHTTYELGGNYADLGATGQADTAEVSLNWPLLRGRTQSLYASGSLAAKRLRDQIALDHSVIPKTVYAGNLGLRYEAWSQMMTRPLAMQLSAVITQGHLTIDDAAQAAANHAGARTTGDYAHLNLAVSAQWEWASDWQLAVSWAGQKALLNKNLDPSEQMSISGADGVRVYRESVTGDNGYLVNADIRYQLPPVADGWVNALSLFADQGRVDLQDGRYATVHATRLADVGVGYQGRYQALFANLRVARAVGLRSTSEPTAKFRLLAQVGLSY